MLRHKLPFLVGTGLWALLSGCVATDSRAPDTYQAPIANAQTATLIGSRVTVGGLFGDEYTGFIAMIDYYPIDKAADDWNKAIVLTPGKHTVVAEFHYSNFMARAYLSLQAKAGATYQLRIKYTPATPTENQRFNDFWIIDQSTGQPVTKVFHQQATGGKQGTIFNIPY